MKHLILLHGALGHTQNFDALLPGLAKHFTVHRILFEGHGTSANFDAPLRIESYVSQVQQYIGAHNLKDIHFFGYSMGGYVALCYALQFPDRINSILTLATKFDWTEESARKESKMLNPITIAEKVPKYAAQLAQLHGDENWQQLLPAIADMMIKLGKNPILNSVTLPQIECHVQVMVGDKDSMVTPEETLMVAKNIPDAKLAVLPNTKHPIEQIRHQLLLDLMSDFWQLKDLNY